MAGNSRRAQPAGKRQPATRASQTVRRNMRMDPEDTTRILLWGATLAIILLTAFLVTFGYYWSTVRPRSRTVLKVDDVSVSYSAMKRRMAEEYYRSPSLQNSRSVSIIPTLAYQNLVEELTVVQHASELGISYDQSELDKELRSQVGASADASAQDFGEKYRQALSTAHVNEAEYRRATIASLLKHKIQDKLIADLGDKTTQAKVEVIVTADEATANRAIERVNAGEDWAAVAKELSTESDVQTTGGLKDYQPQGGSPAVYDDYAFSANVGQVSSALKESPNSDSSRWFVVRVVDRSEQPITDSQKSQLRNSLYQKWVTDTQSHVRILDKWSNDVKAQADAANPLLKDALNKDRARAQTPVAPVQSFPTAVVTEAAPTTPQVGSPVAPAPSPPAP